MTKWTPERLDKFRELAATRKASEIAEYFGITITNVYTIASRNRIRIRGVTRRKRKSEKVKTEDESDPMEDIATRIRVLRGEAPRPDKPRRSFTDGQLKRFIESVDIFAMEVLSVELQDYQLEMCEKMTSHNRCCFVFGRQTGKDFTGALFALWMCITKPGSKVLLVSAAQRQSDLLMERIFSFISQSPELFDSVSSHSMTELRFTNDSVIYALPASGRIRGFSEVDLIIANEVRDIPDLDFDSLYPMLAVNNGSMVLMSTPRGTRGHLWECFNSPSFEKMQLPTRVNRYVSQEYLETQRRSMSAASFAVEHEAQFMDAANAYFNPDVLQKCVKDYDLVMVPDAEKDYFLGVDWGRIRDSSVLTVISKDEDAKLKVEYIRGFTDTPFKDQLAFIGYLHSRFKFRKIVSEYAGLGMGPTETLISEKYPVIKFKPTVSEKLRAYDWLKLKMESGELTLPNHSMLMTELKLFQFAVTPSGNIKLHHVGSGSDDYATSLCLAVWACKELDFKPGFAIIDFRSTGEKIPWWGRRSPFKLF